MLPARRSLLQIALRSPASWLFALTVVLFTVFPRIDLAVSAWYYGQPYGFAINANPAVQWFHEFWGRLPQVVGAGLALFVVACKLWKPLAAGGRERIAVFCLVSLLLGPSLVVNGLKETWGRARPKDVIEFGGSARFTPALLPTRQCDSNCAFTSGHAAFGFWLMVPAFFDPTRRRLWLTLGIAAGLATGWLRIAMGGHFLSDVLFSGWIVYGCAALTCWALSLAWRTPPPWHPVAPIRHA